MELAPADRVPAVSPAGAGSGLPGTAETQGDRFPDGFGSSPASLASFPRGENASLVSQGRQAFLVRLADALRPLESALEVQFEACRILGEHLGVNRVNFFEIRGTDYVVGRDYCAGVPSIIGRHPVASFGQELLDTYRAGRVALDSDTEANPELTAGQRAGFAAINIRAYIGVPLVKGGEFVAGLSVHSVTARKWTPEEVQLAEDVVERTWTAVMRARSEEELRRSEGRLRLLEALGEATRTLDDPRAVLASATRLLGERLRATRCTYADVEPDNDRFTIRDDWTAPGASSIAGTYSLDLFGPRTAAELRAGRVLIHRDVDAESLPVDVTEMFAAIGLKAAVTIPLVKDGRLRAMMAVHSATPRDWADDEVALVRSVAERSWAHIERVRAEMALRESEEQTRVAVATAKLGQWRVDLRTAEMTCSEGCKRNYGRPPGEPFTYAQLWESVHPGDRGRVQAAVRDAIQTRGDYDVEYRVLWPDGGTHWVLVRGRASYDSEGTPTAMGGMTLDITERKHSEERLRESEERRRLALEAAELGAWNIDPATGELEADERFRRIFQGSATALPYEGAFALIHPEDRERVRAGVAAATRPDDPAPYAEEYRVVHPGGEVRWVFAKGRANFSETPSGRQLTSFDGTVADITERKQQQERLRESEERYRRLFETIDEGFCMIDLIFDADGRATDWVYLEANPAFEKQSGVVGAVGRRIREIAPNHEEHWFEIYGRVARTGEAIRFEQEARELGRWFDFYAFRVGGEGSTKVAVIFNDITARRLAAKETERLFGELQAQDRRKDEFLAMLSHELRNPLAPIANAVQLLRLHGGEDPVQLEARTVIERQVGQLKHLIDDLLEVSRITTGRVQIRPERVTVGGIVERAVETTRPLVERRRHALEVRVPPEPIWLQADAARLEQVIVNLLTNAAKYTDEGGRITLEAAAEGKEAVLRARDTGVGIAPELLPRIFDLFTQAERSLARSEGGLGIGLALVRSLVELHGGRVEATSAVGQGSEFTVRLPLAASPARQSPPAPAPATAPPPAPPGSCRVLVVDDNVDSAGSLARLLRLKRHEVRTAHDGPEALAIAAEQVPDVVLLDIGLPEMDGYEVARRMREQPALANAVLVALTGYGQETDRRLSREAGFDHHMVKPADFAQLQQILADAAARKG